MNQCLMTVRMPRRDLYISDHVTYDLYISDHVTYDLYISFHVTYYLYISDHVTSLAFPWSRACVFCGMGCKSDKM